MIKKLNTFLFIALTFFISDIQAQYFREFFDVNKGEQIKTRLGYRPLVMEHNSADNSYYVVNYPGVGTKHHISRFGENLKQEMDAEIDLWFNRKMQDFENMVYFGDSLLLFSSSNNTWLTQHRLYLQHINPETLEQSEAKVLIESENIFNHFSEYIITRSEDRSKLMVCNYTAIPRKETIRLKVYVYDTEMNLLWQAEKIFPNLDKYSHLMQLVVDNNGDAFFLLSVYRERIWKMKAELKNQIGVATFTSKGKNIKLHRIDIPYLYVRDSKIVPTHTGKVNCVGMYSSNFTDEYAKGTYFITINPATDTREAVKMNPFEYFLLEQHQTEKDIEKGRELFNYYIDTLIIRPDKSVVAVLEQQYQEQVHIRQMNPRANQYNRDLQLVETVRYRKKYNDVIVMKFNPQGNIEWSHSIKKKQEYEYDFVNFCSVGTYAPQNADEVFLFYNVYRRNPKRRKRKRDKDREFEFYPRLFSSFKVFVVNDIGLSEEKILFHTDKKECIPMPKSYIDPYNHTFIFSGMHYHKFNLIKLKYRPKQ